MAHSIPLRPTLPRALRLSLSLSLSLSPSICPLSPQSEMDTGQTNADRRSVLSRSLWKTDFNKNTGWKYHLIAACLFWSSDVSHARDNEDGLRITSSMLCVIHTYVSFCIGFGYKSRFISSRSWQRRRNTEARLSIGLGPWRTWKPQKINVFALSAGDFWHGGLYELSCGAHANRGTRLMALSKHFPHSLWLFVFIPSSITISISRFWWITQVFSISHLVEKVPGLCCIIEMDLLNFS